MKPNIAIVGATGAVGKELLVLIEERDLPYHSIDLVASSRSDGKKVQFQEKILTIKDLQTFNFSDVDIAFFSAGTTISRIWVEKATKQGALVIDNTNAYRMDNNVALIIPQVNWNDYASYSEPKIIANPNCSTIQMVRTLQPIDKLYDISQVIVSTYQAASGGGLTGINELKADTMQILETGNYQSYSTTLKKFPRPLGFNVVPQIDVFLESGFTLEEHKMLKESRKILKKPKLKLTATAVRVPVINGHSEAVYVECKKNIVREELINTLRACEELMVYDSLDEDGVCTPRFNSNINQVHVSRVRINPENPKGLWLWIMADNLRIGAALNAIQIAEKIISGGKV